MKKVLNLTNIIALLGVCVLFVSCSHDDDVDESMVLSGQWQGNWGMYYEVENPRTGEIVAFDSYDTDIVFDCPHCGHNLAIDYRGAGLQIECVNCGESVLVPIPDGMKIDDLDIEPGEILKQLFAARRNLQRAEGRIEELELELRGVTMRRDTLRALLESFAIQLEELKELARNEVKLREKSTALVSRLAGDIESTIGDAAHGSVMDEDGTDGADAE